MKLSSGRFAGRQLACPKGQDTRPTQNTAREAIFNIIRHRYEAEVEWVLDLFSGSGSLGFEALSNGAQNLISVENSPRAQAILKKNAEALGVSDSFFLIKEGEIPRWARKIRRLLGTKKIGLVFSDPPFDARLSPQIIRWMDHHESLFQENCLWIHELGIKEEVPESPIWSLQKERSQGASKHLFYRKT